MSAHTPGPWYWTEGATIGDMPILRSAAREVCNFGDSQRYYPTEGEPPNEADARLIAAAPDLLAALMAVVRHFPTDADMLIAGWSPAEAGAACDAYDSARAAIAKATEQST